MKTLKKILSITFFISAAMCFAEESFKKDMLNDALSKLRITSTYTNAFNLYNMDAYSEITFGGSTGFEYTLLPELWKNTDIGFYGRAAFQDFVPYNIQLKSLYAYSFSGGFFAQWNFPQDLVLNFSAGAGFLISEIDFISAEEGLVNDVYYDFMLESDVSIRKVLLKTGKADLLGIAGCHAAFYNEKSESFMNIGPCFGLTVDFRPSAAGKSDVDEIKR